MKKKTTHYFCNLFIVNRELWESIIKRSSAKQGSFEVRGLGTFVAELFTSKQGSSQPSLHPLADHRL